MSSFDQILIRRAEWGARKPKQVDTSFTTDLGVVVHHTAKDTRVQSHWPGCYRSMRGHQNYHMDTKGWNDIAYNWMVCPHGFIFEGRGWAAQNGANYPSNDATYSVAVDVNSEIQVPDPAVVKAVNLVIATAITDHESAPIVQGHDDANGDRQTTCPGRHLQGLIDSGVVAPPTVTPVLPTPTEPAPIGVPTADEVRLIAEPTVSIRQMQDWARAKGANATFVRLAPVFSHESRRIGVDPAVPYAISYHETKGGHYGGVVLPSMHNWGGLKTTQGGGNYDVSAHAQFPDDIIGVRAVVQHVACYGGVDLPDDWIVDPRWNLAILGTAPQLPSKGWLWSSTPDAHADRVVSLVREMRGLS